MYLRYQKKTEGERSRYEQPKKVCLFGCNSGWIPKLLMQMTPAEQAEPYSWHLSMESAFAEYGYPGSTIVIDLKPKQKKHNLSLYELLDVWGYSAAGWTPILLHLRGLFVDVNPANIDPRNFTVSSNQEQVPIYEVLYLAGSVANGELTGRWVGPPPSPTNGVLLWPDTVKYFVESIRKCTPGVLA